ERVKTLLDTSAGEPVGVAQVTDAVRRSGLVHGSAAIVETAERLTAEIAGAGPLQPLVEQPGVTDVFVNGPNDVFIDAGGGLHRVDLPLGSADDVRALA